MNSIERSIKQTYVALRWAILVVVALLLLAVIYTGWTTGAWQTSISGYYYTAARPVFVASTVQASVLALLVAGLIAVIDRGHG